MITQKTEQQQTEKTTDTNSEIHTQRSLQKATTC